jgi:hypothetical protein
MRTVARTFWLPKDVGYDAEYEDAAAVDEARGVAAVADGVSSAIFSREWASILTGAVVAGPPRVRESSFWEWLADCRAAWRQQISTYSLTYFQSEKLRECGGAFATLLWVEWEPAPAGLAWRSTAIGDSGLLHVRGGQTLQTFPVSSAEELQADPLTIGSTNRNNDHLLEFHQTEGLCQPGDLLVLCTDALLGWALRELAAGASPPWQEFWDMDAAAWQERMVGLRRRRDLRVDDTTLVLVRVLDEEAAPAAKAEGPHED